MIKMGKQVNEAAVQSVHQALVASGHITDPHSARGKLLQTATNLFRSNGYERTTVRDLASAVGIQSGSIFHHFKSKEAILLAVMQETIYYNTALLQAALEGVVDPKARVLALIECELQSILGGTGEAMAVLVYEWRALSEASRNEVLALRNRYEAIWLDALAQAKEAGLCSAEPALMRRFLMGALSWTITWYRADGPLNIDQLAEAALGMVIPAG